MVTLVMVNAGVAGLIKFQNFGWTPAQVRNQIVNTALDVQNIESNLGWDRYSGYGIIDAEAALGGFSGNIRPVANANGPYVGDAGVNINFSSSGSFDNDGSIVGYEWDFGDGHTSTQANPTHTYTSAGNFFVSLTITDDDGATGSNNATATISGLCSNFELELTLVLDDYPGETTWDLKDAGNNTLASGGPYTIAGETITDTFCLTDGNYTFTIYDSYGDGICCFYGFGFYELAEGTTIHASGGLFGFSESTYFSLTVPNQPPVAVPGGPYIGTVGEPVSFDGSGSNDPDPGDDITSYSWDFGDSSPAGTGVNPTHTYTSSGTFIVTLTVSDFNGGMHSASTTANVIVDTDNDGLPDTWEERYGLDPLDDGSIDINNGPNGNPDGDGLTNIEEYLYGSDPTTAFTTGRPICEIELNGSSFMDGNLVRADVYRIANIGTAAVPVEFAIWLEAPGLFPIRILKIGSMEAGTTQPMTLPPGYELNAPTDLFIVDPTFPRGDYVLGLKMVDPVTQSVLTFDLNHFTILP